MKDALSSIEFKDVYNNSNSLLAQDLLFKYAYNQTPKLGFIVSRKYGNSVQRNLFKRRCRYAFYKLIKEEFPNFKLDYDIDKMRQLIVNSWPNNIDDSNARDQWDWSPKYDLELAFKKYITPGLK